MIEAKSLINSMGKERFVDFVMKNKDKEKTGAEKDRGIKGRVRYRKCSHGVWVIDDYKPQECVGCYGKASDAPNVIIHSHEYFNMGTGTFGTTSEHRKYAKGKGLVEVG